MTQNRPLVIYHGNCADGFGAAWCFWHEYGSNADYYPGVYSKAPPDVSGRDVYLVDFSYKRDVMKVIIEEANKVVLIDHHKSAIEDLEGLPGLERFCDTNHSGAILAWNYLFPNTPRPLLLGHIEDRDLWKFKLKNTREISAALFSHPYSFELWDNLMFGGQKELLSLTIAGAAIERKHHKDIDELLDVCKRLMVIGGYTVPVASLPYTLSSDAAGKMAIGEVFAACYWDTRDNRTFSLRSQPDGIDVSKIAAEYGGGGHKNAAGFSVPRDHPLAVA